MSWAVGWHAVRAAVQAGKALELWVQAGRRDRRLAELVALARARGVPVRRVAEQALRRIAGEVPHQGVVARTEGFRHLALDVWLAQQGARSDLLALALDEVQDPHNLGAVARSAAAAGAHGLVLPLRRAALPDAPAAQKAAAGAFAHLPVVLVGNLARALATMAERNIAVIGLAAEAETPLDALDLTRPCVLVAGNEERGLRPLVRRACTQLAAIPIPGPIASLNVSVAVGVALFEVLRQRRQAASQEASSDASTRTNSRLQ